MIHAVLRRGHLPPRASRQASASARYTKLPIRRDQCASMTIPHETDYWMFCMAERSRHGFSRFQGRLRLIIRRSRSANGYCRQRRSTCEVTVSRPVQYLTPGRPGRGRSRDPIHADPNDKVSVRLQREVRFAFSATPIQKRLSPVSPASSRSSTSRVSCRFPPGPKHRLAEVLLRQRHWRGGRCPSGRHRLAPSSLAISPWRLPSYRGRPCFHRRSPFVACTATSQAHATPARSAPTAFRLSALQTCTTMALR